MNKIRNIFFILLFISFYFIFPAFIEAQNTETVTISTYYPAPSGVYQNLRMFPTVTTPNCATADDEGMIFYDNAAGVNQLRVCRQTSMTPIQYGWQTVGSNWIVANDNIYPNDTTTPWEVGIGTTSPTALLHINSINTNSTTVGAKDARILLQNNTFTGNAGGEVTFAYADTNTSRYASIGSAAISNVIGGGTGRVYIATKENDADTFLTERMVVLPNGNIGAGTTNPRARLEVNDTLLLTPRASDPAATTEGIFYYNNSASVKGFKYYDGSIWRTFGNADLYVRNASGVAQKKNSPKILLGSVSGLTTGAWNTVSWTNTPFTNIYAVLLTPSDGGGYEFDARTNGTNNSVQIQPDSNGMIITFLVIGD